MGKVTCKKCGIAYEFKGQIVPTSMKCFCESDDFQNN